jgi:hypothetical protein
MFGLGFKFERDNVEYKYVFHFEIDMLWIIAGAIALVGTLAYLYFG